MDDYNVSNLHESKNEYYNYLLNALTPLIMEGIESIFNESLELCNKNKEPEKYLKNFQKILKVIPTWNEKIIMDETKRIKTKSTYKNLEELISCVHIIQTKILTMSRVGQKQKKIDIPFPSLERFIHDIYIESARSFYTKIFLFRIYDEKTKNKLLNLKIQENNYEKEKIVQRCILNVIRKNIPIESIVSAYLDETEEEGVEEEIKKEIIISEPIKVEKEEEKVEKVEKEEEKREKEVMFNDIELSRDENNNESVALIKPKEEEEEIKLEINDELSELDLSDFVSTTEEVYELPDL
uniref:Uncharacterized protein n=1 Tax=viral metagenome TaxID=1070528 RepID=A0A6C0H580_9ZZZZ